MKISKEEYAALKSAIEAIPTDKLRAYADSIRKEYAEKHKDNPKRDAEKRVRWDAYWSVKRTLPEDFAVSLKDEHLDTALRSIVCPIIAA